MRHAFDSFSAPCRGLRRAALACGVGIALLAAGCATPTSVTTDVASYGTWPPQRAPGSYVFERLPSQQDDAARAEFIENAARGAVERAGFRPAADRASAEFNVQVGVRVIRVVDDGFYDPWWPYGPRVFWNLGWGFHRRGAGFGFGYYGGMPMASVDYEREVAMILRDAKTNAVLYETHARYDSRYSGDGMLPVLFDAAMRDFPNGTGKRQVTMPLVAGAVGVPARTPSNYYSKPPQPVGVPASAAP